MSISLYHGKKNNFKSLKKLISGESRDLNMHNNLILVSWAYSSNFSKLVSVCMLSPELCPLFVTLWKLACESSLSMELSRQEYWSGVLCPPQGDLYHHPKFLSLADDCISGGDLGHLQRLQSFIEYLLCIHQICMFMHFYVFTSC